MNDDVAIFLQTTELTVISNAACRAFWGRKGYEYNICVDTSSLMGPCKGDSGGPLVLPYISGPVLIGVTSFVDAAGCKIGSPASFTKISPYLNWIRKHTE